MKYTVYILIIAALLGTGSGYRFLMKASRTERSRLQATTEETKTEHGTLTASADNIPARLPEPDPMPKAERSVPRKKAAPPAEQQRRVNPHAGRQAALRRYWESRTRQFDRQKEQLTREEDPAKRMNLIRSMSSHVRIDTFSAIEWAMGMVDPVEQRAALEAINANSLSGIGARIEVDETGFPKIRETTVLSAIAATGQVEPGDYIVGMDGGDGQPIQFEGLSPGKVAQYLRGRPGTEVRLRMERVPADGSVSHAYDVVVQRSLLVIQPPL